MYRFINLAVFGYLAVGAIPMGPEGRPPDQQFAIRAMQTATMEIQIGQLTVEQAGSNEIQELGLRMVQCHGTVAENLRELMEQKSIETPNETPRDLQQAWETLRKINGKDFDREYLAFVIADHRELVRLFEEEVSNGQDNGFKALAFLALPTLRQHLKKAEEVEAKLSTNP